MIQIFTGDDRIKAAAAIKQTLGDDYEIIEGADLLPADLPTIMQGTTLFATTRHILIRDLSTNKAAFDELPKYLDTPHNIIIQELKLDKRSATYKTLKDQITVKEFKLPDNPNFRKVFDIYKIAKHDGPRALALLDTIKQDEDPIKFTGLLASQALKDYARNPKGTKEKRVLKELSKLDLDLKSTSLQPWLLVQSFLLRLSSLA